MDISKELIKTRAFWEIVNRDCREDGTRLLSRLYFRPKRNCLPFLASESTLLAEDVSSIAFSTGFCGTSSGWKTFPAPPRPACWTPLLDRRTTLHIYCKFELRMLRLGARNGRVPLTVQRPGGDGPQRDRCLWPCYPCLPAPW